MRSSHGFYLLPILAVLASTAQAVATATASTAQAIDTSIASITLLPTSLPRPDPIETFSSINSTTGTVAMTFHALTDTTPLSTISIMTTTASVTVTPTSSFAETATASSSSGVSTTTTSSSSSATVDTPGDASQTGANNEQGAAWRNTGMGIEGALAGLGVGVFFAYL